MKDKKQLIAREDFVDFLLYKSPNGEVKVDVLLQNETIWLPQKKIAELFDVNVPAVSKHLINIYKEYELEKYATVSILETVQREGGRSVKRKMEFYNLDAIIAVGYRINSKRATQFRIWATKILKEFIVKGFAMDDERLKNPNPAFGKDYFDEQLERIRDIRSSERRFYQKITDIYAQCSVDYDNKSETTKTFFATVQNKLHYSTTKQTAAEVITSRADHTKKNMGLTTWKNAPNSPIRKSDVVVAKNYLNEKELESLNRIVTMYLDYAENQALRGIAMSMGDWVKKLNAFLQFNEYDILKNAGRVTAEIAKEFAGSEFEKYRISQDRMFVSDFDKMVKKLETNKE